MKKMIYEIEDIVIATFASMMVAVMAGILTLMMTGQLAVVGVIMAVAFVLDMLSYFWRPMVKVRMEIIRRFRKNEDYGNE